MVDDRQWHIRCAEPGDVGVLAALLEETSGWLRSKGVEQWPTRFDPNVLTPAIEAGETRLVLSGQDLIGTVTVDYDDPVWSDLPGHAAYIDSRSARTGGGWEESSSTGSRARRPGAAATASGWSAWPLTVGSAGTTRSAASSRGGRSSRGAHLDNARAALVLPGRSSFGSNGTSVAWPFRSMTGSDVTGGDGGHPFDMIVLDIDDTVIDIDDVIRPRVQAAIGAVDHSDAHLVLATGRGASAASLVVQQLALQNCHVVSGDGSVIFRWSPFHVAPHQDLRPEDRRGGGRAGPR